MRRGIVLSTIIGVALSIAPAVSEGAATHDVFMSAGNRFCVSGPVCTANENITIQVGDTVRWRYADPVCSAINAIGCFHTATRNTAPQAFNSGAMPGAPANGLPSPKLEFSHTFTQTGTFQYVCTVHAANFGMIATVVVNP